jgi:hypothetical protein
MHSQQPPGPRGPHDPQPLDGSWQPPSSPYQPPPGGPYQQPLPQKQRREVIELSDAIPPNYVPPDRHRERVKVAIVGSVEAVLLVLGAVAGLSPAFVFLMIAFTGVAAWIGAYKGRTADAMILGFVLGIIGVIIIAFLPKTYDRRVFEEARRRAVARDAELYGRAAGQ